MKNTKLILRKNLLTAKPAGFTLIEVLVVVLIIGILAAFAVPWYQRAILKSRFNSVISGVRTIARAQEVYYLSKNVYAQSMDELDITHDNEDDAAEITLSTDEKYKYVMGYHKDAPQVRYVVFLKHSENFPDNIHCEALTGNDDAEWLCKEELQGYRLKHGSLEGASYTTYILQGSATDGSFSQTYQDGTGLTLTNGDVCQAQSAGGCSASTFVESTCAGNQTGGCQNNVFTDSTCNGNAGGGNAGTTVCGHNTYNHSECHGEDGPNGFICGRSDYNHNSACYSNNSGGCGHSTFDDGSTCYAHGNTACQQSEFTDSACIVESGGGCHNNSTFSNSTCTVEAGGGCTGNTFTNGSVCRTSVGGTSSSRACGTGSTYDHSTCYNDSTTSYLGCGQGTYNNHSACHSSTKGGCGRATFDGNSVCYGNGNGACGTNTYTNNSVCYAMVPGACNDNTYLSGSYCDGPHCPSGTPGPGGTTH